MVAEDPFDSLCGSSPGTCSRWILVVVGFTSPSTLGLNPQVPSFGHFGTLEIE